MLVLLENIKKEIIGVVYDKRTNDFYFASKSNNGYSYIQGLSLFYLHSENKFFGEFGYGLTLYDIDKAHEDYFHDQMNGAIFGAEPKDIVKETKEKILESLSYKTKNGTKIDY